MSIDLGQISRVDAGMTALNSYQLDLTRASRNLDEADGSPSNIDARISHRPDQLCSELGIRHSISFPSSSASCNSAASCTLFPRINNTTYSVLYTFLVQPDLLFCPDS